MKSKINRLLEFIVFTAFFAITIFPAETRILNLTSGEVDFYETLKAAAHFGGSGLDDFS